MKDQLLDLAQRCENATQPDAELNAEIQVRVFEKPDYVFPNEVLNRRPADWQEAASRFRHDGMGGSPLYPDYTFSIDAAMKLVPEGWRCHTISQPRPDEHVSAGLVGPPFMSAQGFGKTWPLAVCAAALRARAAQ